MNPKLFLIKWSFVIEIRIECGPRYVYIRQRSRQRYRTLSWRVVIQTVAKIRIAMNLICNQTIQIQRVKDAWYGASTVRIVFF